MVVVSAFGILNGTENAGMVAYYRAPGCTEVTIADVLPILSKINYYEDEYVIGEMLIWDTGEQSAEPNNCAMVRVIVYNDGWICAWFDKTTTVQLAIGGAQYVDAQTLGGWGSALEYEDKFNSYQLKITGSTDPICPSGTIFGIRDTDYVNGRVQVHTNEANSLCFNSGYTYNAEIYMSNGNFLWWGVSPNSGTNVPPTNSNRLYRAIYQIWTIIKTSSNSTNWSSGNASIVYMYDSQLDTYTNETSNFNSSTPNDCQILPTDEVINDAFYIGHSSKFNGITITMGTLGVGLAITWEYWNGSIWTTLTCVDDSTGFTATGELTFNPPDSWNTKTVNGNDFFWIRARVTTASYTVTPILTQGRLYLQNDIGYLEIEFGIYNFEFTGANYCLISGKKIYDGTSADFKEAFFYTTPLPTTTIYDHQIIAAGNLAWGTDVSNIIINGNYIYGSKPGTGSVTPGYVSLDITGIDYISGIQNVYYIKVIRGTYSTYRGCSCSSVLLVS